MQEDRESGTGWFQRILLDSLKGYAQTTSADKLRKQYAGLPRDVIANRTISRVSRATLVAGALSGAAISVAELPAMASVAGTILSVFTASPVTVPILAISLPVAIVAFGAEMVYTLRMQIRMAYDLFLLYDLPLDPDDPQALWEAFLIGLGAQGGETVGQALRVTVPKVAAQQAQDLMRSGLIRRRVHDWVEKRLSRQLARRYLAEGFLLKMVVPGLNIVLSAGWNYFTTQGLGRFIVWRVRGQAMARDLINEIGLTHVVSGELLLGVTHYLLSNRLGPIEREAHSRLVERLREIHPTLRPKVMDRDWIDWTSLYPKLTAIQDLDSRRMIYDVMQAIAIVDGRVSRREMRYISQVAELYEFSLDKEALKARAKRFAQPRPGRSCLLAATLITFLLVLAIVVCIAGSIVALFMARGPVSG